MGYNIAFSGLNATAEAIDVTSNNIANAQTVGYKAGQYLFADQFFRAQDPQSLSRSGMGTSRQMIRRDMNYGTVTDTQNPLDVALTGPGMFVLAKNTSGTVPTQTPDTFQFTRNGQFGVDSNNRIVNENGMYIVGYPTNVDGKSINKSQFSILTLDQSPMPAKQTSTSTLAMNLDNRGNPIQAVFDPTQVNSYTQTTSQTVFDSGGNQHTLSTYYVKQNPATLYMYPQNGGADPTTATIFAFNPNQDTSALADNFSANQNPTGVANGVGIANQMASTTTPSTGQAVANESLSGVTIVAYPAGQNSTYQMTLSDGTQLMVTAQRTVNAAGNTIVRYAYAADRYASYATVDGINVNRTIGAGGTLGVGSALTPATTVSQVSVGGALTGSAAAGTYILGTQAFTGQLQGTFAVMPAATGGVAGTYTVNVTGGTGTGGVATISYNGANITAIQLSGGTNYAAGDTLTIPAGSLGAGSNAVALAALAAGNTLSGTQVTLKTGAGLPIPSAQTLNAGAAGSSQTFSFANGVSFTLNSSGADTVATMTAALAGKTVIVQNNPIGYMGFVAGKNIDGMQRDQFGVPAYTTKTSVNTTVGSATRVNQLAITIDSTNMTAYSAAQSTYANAQDGNSLSQVTAYMIDNSGILQATYSNGQTLMKGQLAIANFNNTAGLIPVGNNSFEMSGITGLQSGSAIYGTANSGNLGAIRSKAVESSNVDLTSELVKLMTLQRQYSANSQAVKVEAATIVDDAIRIGQ